MLRSQTTKLTLRTEDLKEYEHVKKSWEPFRKEQSQSNSGNNINNNNNSSSAFDSMSSGHGGINNSMLDERVNNIRSRIGLIDSSP